MPTQAANLTALRTDGSFALVYLSVYQGAEVMTATITAPSSYPAKNLAIAVVTGSASNVKAGYRVDVYRSDGTTFKGRTRVRYAGTISSGNLPIREMSSGYMTLVTGDIVKVYADVRLSDKLVTATKNFNPDDLSYSDQGSNPPPLASSGGPWAGWATMLPIPLTGSNSIVVDPDGGSLTHLYTYPSGLTGSSTTAADPNITAATAGEYLLPHAVTNSGSGKVTTQYVPIIVHDSSFPPHHVVVDSVDGDEDSGWSFRVRWMDDTATLAAIPDGAFCILWMEQYVNGTVQSFGEKSSGRSHILGTGYLRREEASFESETGIESLSFEVISPLARLGELIGYSKVMTSDSSPDNWGELKTLGVKRGMIQLYQFYSNANEAGFDLLFASTYSDAVYPQFFIQKSNPLGQLRELADGRDALLVEDRSGRFEVHTDGAYYAIGSRAAATKTITLTTSDIKRWRYSRDHWRPVEIVETHGFTSGGNPQPKFSKWPGSAPGMGNQASTVERLITVATGAAGQTELNERAGRRGAAAEGIYVDSNGGLQTALDLEITLPTSYHVADFYDEYVAITLTTALRGLDLSGQLFVLRGVSLGMGEDGSMEVTWTLRTATNGAAGETYVPPQESDNGLPVLPPIDLVFPTPIAPVSTIVGGQMSPSKIWQLDAGAAKAWYATAIDLVTGECNWTENSTGLAGTGIWGCSDPHHYQRRYALMTDGLFRNEDLYGGASWSLVAAPGTVKSSLTAFVGGTVVMSINLPGWICICYGAYSISVSFDDGATWTPAFLNMQQAFLGTVIETTGVAYPCVVEPTGYNPNSGAAGKLYSSFIQPVGGNSAVVIGRSLDWGLTWYAAPVNGHGTTGEDLVWTLFGGPGGLHVPYRKRGGAANTNSATDQDVIAFAQQFVGRTHAVASQDVQVFGAEYGSALNSARPVTAWTNDSNYLWMVGSGSGLQYLWRSIDGGATWTQSAVQIARNIQMELCVNGFPTNKDFALFWCRRGGTALVPGIIGMTIDGSTFIELSDPGLATGLNTAYVEADISDLSVRA